MAITNGYCTLTEFKSYKNIDSINAADDTVIEGIIESISRLIDGEVKRHFYQVTEARYYSATDLDILYCDDIATTTGLEIKSSLNSDGTYSYTWATTDYNLRPYTPKTGWPYTHIEISDFGLYSFDKYKKGNKITATWGWPAIPKDIKNVCMSEAMSQYLKRTGENTNTATTITSAGIVITPQGWSKDSIQTLGKYRKSM